jgi:hypothetical protein
MRLVGKRTQPTDHQAGQANAMLATELQVNTVDKAVEHEPHAGKPAAIDPTNYES